MYRFLAADVSPAVAQEKEDKNYALKVQAHWDKIKEKRDKPKLKS